MQVTYIRRFYSAMIHGPSIQYQFAAVRGLHLAIAIYSIFLLYVGELSLSAPAILISFFLAAIGQIFVVNIVGHRFIGHNGFRPSKFSQFALLLWSVIYGLASPLSASLVHRRHHQFPDSARDPHSPPHGQFVKMARYSIRMYFNFLQQEGFPLLAIIRESRRPYFIFFHRYGAQLSLLTSLTIYLIGGFKVLLLVQSIPVLVCAIGQLNLVLWTHTPIHADSWQNQSVDSVLANLLTLGEGAHNSHHNSPNRTYYSSDRILMFDLTGFLIGTIWSEKAQRRSTQL